MNNNDIINIAKQFLISNKIDFVEPGSLGKLNGIEQEVIFLDPQTLDPDVAVVDPGDVRVLVNLNTKKVTLVYQM